jgi:hypothetical protein
LIFNLIPYLPCKYTTLLLGSQVTLQELLICF